jgi:uncharacterized protein
MSSTALTFRRVGATPGARPDLAPVSWQASDTPLSQGMNPLGRSWYTDGSGRIDSGIWACNAGTVAIKENPVEEICFVIRGTVKVTDAAGRSESFGAGECLALPRGFTGTWSQSDDFAKFYVIVEPA